MLNDLAFVIQTKDIDARIFQVLGPDLVAVQDDVLSIGDRAVRLQRDPAVLQHRNEPADGISACWHNLVMFYVVRRKQAFCRLDIDVGMNRAGFAGG